MHRMPLYIILLLLQVIFTIPASAATLPPPLQLVSNIGALSNGSHGYVKCSSKPNVTYPIYDSPLDLAMTFGDRPLLSWQLVTFLQTILIAIKGNAAEHPDVHLPDRYYYYHKPRELGTLIVVPPLFRDITWSDLYLVLHGLAEYIVTAPHAYEMCVEIIFRRGGFAGVIFVQWWTPNAPTIENPLRGRGVGETSFL